MTEFAQLTLFHAVVLGVLAALCACVYMAMRSDKAIVWLGGALLCGAIDTMMLSFLADTALQEIALVALLPITYICYARAVRHATHHSPVLPIFDRPVAALSSLALVMLIAGAPYVVHAAPFQLACALTVGESAARIFRARSHHVLDIDNALATCLATIAAIYLVRTVSFPFVFGMGATYAEIKATRFEATLSAAAAILTAPAGILLLARIIGTTIAAWRNRAERDYMTGLLSREAFDRAASATGPSGGAVVFCDIDHFKQVNDRFGHHSGDQVIRTFGGILARSGHVVGRLGGDEFAVVLKGANGAEAVAMAERIRVDFHASSVPGIPTRERLGASFGVAIYSPEMSPMEAFLDADSALYRAKAEGRNRVHLCDDAEQAAKVVPIGTAGTSASA